MLRGEAQRGTRVAHLEICLLGPFATVLDGDLVTEFESDSTRAVLAYLASEPGRLRPRAVVAELLWPERREGAALSNLRHVLSVLRKALGESEAEPRVLQSDRNSLSLASSPDVWVDLVEFERLAATSADEEGAVEAWEQAVGLWRGALLEDIQLRAGAEWDEWLVVTAERTRRQLAGVLRSLAVHHERAGDWERALSFAGRLTEVDPWDERAHRQRMRLLARIGESARALSLFSELQERLDTELGSEPAVETTVLADQIRAGDLSGAVPEIEICYPHFLTEVQSDVAAPLFVGRERELGFLRSHLDAALDGRGHVVLVAGEAGSGKTMLSAEFRNLATAVPDVLAVQGRCNAFAGLGDPYLPFREILGALTGDVEPLYRAGATNREQATRLWEAIPHSARLVYERGPSLLSVMVSGAPLVERVEQAMPGAEWLDGLRMNAEAMVRRPPVPERLQPALFDEYTAVLEGLAPTHPLLLIVDDLQWSDLGSIALLWHLARRLEGQRILLLGLYRPEEIADVASETHPLEPVLHELRAATPDCSIELGPDRGFIDALVDSEPNLLNTEFRDRLFACTGGHPLFTVEMVRDMQERAEIRRSQAGAWRARESLDWDRLPTRVESVIAQRIARLPSDLQADLTVAAVQGEEFVAEAVAAVREDQDAPARLSMESTSPHRLIEPSGVSRVDGRLVARHRFRHILFQRYLYGLLGEAERARLHESTGRAIEEVFRGHAEPPVVDLAHHFDEAGLAESAIPYLQLAGQRAFRMSANEEAIRHLQRAIELLVDLPESPQRDNLELGLRVALAASVMAVRGYTAPELERSGQRIRELCDRLEPSPMTALALSTVSHFSTIRAAHADALRLTREVLAIAEDLDDSGLTILGHYTTGYEETWQGELSSGHQHLETAHRDHDPEQHGWLVYALGLAVGPEALVWDAFNMAHRGYPDRAIRLAEQGIALARSIGHPFSLCHAVGIGGVLVRFILGEFEDSLRRNVEFAEVAGAEHFEFWTIAADIYRGTALANLGDPGAGLTLVQQGFDDWNAMGVGAFRGYWRSVMAGIEQLRGRSERGLEIVESELGPAAESLEGLCYAHLHVRRSSLMKELGEPKAAIDAAEQAVDVAREIGARLLELRAATDLATAHIAAGGVGDAEEALMPIYSWFTEGLDTPYLVAARRVLERL